MPKGIYKRTKEMYDSRRGNKPRKGMGPTNGSFKEGNLPWNKGTKGIMKPNSGSFKKGIHPATQFKKGHKKSNNWNKVMETKMRGKNHWNWKGGISSINTRIRHSKEYRLWREAVFIRDDFTCRFCGQRGGRLNADHIKPFSKGGESTKDNLQTLCSDCNLGKGNNKI